MKRIISVILALTMVFALCGCKGDSQQGSFVFTKENYPKMGGSLAALPLGEALTANALGIERDEASSMLVFEGSTTDNYEALVDGTFDIILAYEPSGEALAYAEEKGVKLEFETIGLDALVFITGKENPVENLTTQEIKDIYTGKTTRWSEVGGNDQKILAFQRNKDSGSQTLFDKLINLGDDLMKPQSDYIVGSMIGLLEAISGYNGTDEALGYTVYYYLTNMEASTLATSKLISVDGVMPSNETIANGDYKLVNEFYVVMRADEAQDSPTRILFDWICSSQGREIAENENYVVPNK